MKESRLLGAPVRNKIILIFIALFIVGCAAHTGVVQIGEDTYMVNEQGWISTQSVGALKAETYKQANAYCLQQNKKLMPVSTSTTPGEIGRSYPEAELQFMCLSESDYELKRPKLKPLPDVRIEGAR